MAALVFLMLFVCIALPLGFAWRLWTLDEPDRLGWLIVFADSLVFVTLIVILGRWDMAGIWTRDGLIAILTIAILVSLRRHIHRPWQKAGKPPLRRRMPTLLSLALFGTSLVYVASAGILPRHTPRPLTFPLGEGWFIVAQGGAIGLLNHHNGHRAQHQALDITALNSAGFRASGLLPADPDRYVIFGKPVISPCDGTVVVARDGLPDLSPPLRDRKHPAGNHVVLSCGDMHVLLAHLRQNSLLVKAGAHLRTGARIAEVGNSGNTTEPHLHIHAVDPRTGTGLQIAFDGIVPVRNARFTRN